MDVVYNEESNMLQEDDGVNHIAAKIIDSISARPGPHAAVCVDIFVFAVWMVCLPVEVFKLLSKTASWKINFGWIMVLNSVL